MVTVSTPARTPSPIQCLLWAPVCCRGCSDWMEGFFWAPLLLALLVPPMTASATTAALMLYASSTATVTFAVAGRRPLRLASVGMLLGISATAAGQHLSQRPSYIAFSIGLVVGLSAMAMTVESVQTI